MRTTPTAAKSEEPIVRIFDAYKAAVFAKDIAAFISLYDENVRVFDMWGKWSYDGVEAWRKTVADWFGSLGKDRVVVGVDGVQTIRTRDVAVAHAIVTYKGVSDDGRELRAMNNRLTWALKQASDGWKIVHEHTSAPVNIETSKLVLE